MSHAFTRPPSVPLQGLAPEATARRRHLPLARCRPALQSGFTLVEVMVSIVLLTMFMLGFLGAFIESRKVTESAIMHAAATSIIYGMIEQIKQLDYTDALPSTVTDPGDPGATTPPFMRVRMNQNTIKWLRVAPSTAVSPTITPAPTAATPSGAVDNILGALPLSTVTGARAQSINLNLWIWVDEIPDPTNDVSDVKKITVVYTYSFQSGTSLRTFRNREVILRTRYDQ